MRYFYNSSLLTLNCSTCRPAEIVFSPSAALMSSPQSFFSMVPIFRQFRSALAVGTKAEAIAKTAAAMPKKRPEKTFDWDSFRPLFQQQLNKVLNTLGLNTGFMNERLSRVYEAVRTERSMRKAHLRVQGLQNLDVTASLHLDDLPLAKVFFKAADELFHQLANQGIELSENAIRKLDPYAAPGFRLKMAAHRGRRPHPKQPEPGDQIDEDHISFAPYVDMLFLDVRTFGFAAQETLRNPTLTPPHSIENLHKPTDLAHVSRLIETEYRKLHA
jgi:hypothetical protein